jgi:serine O-acetyltransferase
MLQAWWFEALSTGVINLVSLNVTGAIARVMQTCYKQENIAPNCHLNAMLIPFTRHSLRQFLPEWTFPQLSCPIIDDFNVIFDRDPAARNGLEVLLCYPGFHAIAIHRGSHWLHNRRIPLLPRLLSHFARFMTGIEIHPGAQLGKGIVIDHGMGVVIGETAIIGDYTLIYQGVTLGGTGKETGKRHPTIGAHVVIGAGAKILGNIGIGDYARIGAGSIVLTTVPANCTAVGVPSRNVCRCNTAQTPLEHGQLPDANAQTLRSLLDRIQELEAQIESLSQASLSPSEDWRKLY